MADELGDRIRDSAWKWAERLYADRRVPPEDWIPDSLDAEVDERSLFRDDEVGGLGKVALRILASSAITSLSLQLADLLEVSESPIEAAMNLAVIVDAHSHREWDVVLRHPEGRDWLFGRETQLLGRSELEREWKRALRVEPQAQLGDYRVDLLLTLEGEAREKEGHRRVAEKRMVIECQGHDFHERTKEQASRDYERTRTLQSFGFLVFPYSGSHVWSDVFDHAESALATLDDGVRGQLFPVQA